MTYQVSLFTHSVDNAGERLTDEKNFNFNEENLLEARRKAILKAKELLEICQANPKFVSGTTAEAIEYKGYSAYSLEIYFGEDVIYGEENIEGLQSELNYYMDHGYDVEIVYLENEDIEILEEDYEFLINN